MLDFDEVLVWVVSAIFLGFLLSFEVAWPMIYIDWSQVLLMCAFALIFLFVFIVGEKMMAYLLDCKIKIKWLSFKQYWFEDRFRLKWGFPLWIVLPLITFLISAGKFVWTAILGFDVEIKSSRIKKMFYDLDEIDVAKIAVAGPIAVIILGIIFRIAGLNDLAIMSLLLAFLAVIPIGQGFKIFMGSKLWAVFMIALTGLIFVLSLASGVLATIVIGVL